MPPPPGWPWILKCLTFRTWIIFCIIIVIWVLGDKEKLLFNGDVFLSQVYKRSICPWGIFLFNVWWLMWEDPVYCGWCDSLAVYSWVSFSVPALVFPSYGLWHRRTSQIFYPLTCWLWSLFFFYHSNSKQRQKN